MLRIHLSTRKAPRWRGSSLAYTAGASSGVATGVSSVGVASTGSGVTSAPSIFVSSVESDIVFEITDNQECSMNPVIYLQV